MTQPLAVCSNPGVAPAASGKDFGAVEANLRLALRFFGQSQSEGVIQDSPSLTMISSGLNYGVFNSALLTKPANTDELDQSILQARDFFTDRGVRWSFWICEDLLDREAQRKCRKLFAERGLRQISEMPGMYAEHLAPASNNLPAIEFRRVQDEDTRAAFTQITSIAFEIPANICEAVYQPARSWQGDYHGYLGYLNGMPVSTTAIVAAEDAIGVYSVGTLPAFRRKGIGESLMRMAIADARRKTGIERTILQSSEQGFGLYRRMGYKQVTKFFVYLT